MAAATGPVGATVGQIAKLLGCGAVGIAGGPDNCGYAVQKPGFDACLDHKSADFADRLNAAVPKGIEVYFENVGGAVLAAALRVINKGARIPLCGMISEYNATASAPGPSLRSLLVNRALIQGFIVSDHFERFPAFLKDCSAWLREGRLRYREDIVDGLDQAPSALIGLFEGRNFGKLLVRVSPAPARE